MKTENTSDPAVGSTRLVRQCRIVMHDDGGPLGAFWAAKDVTTGEIIAISFGEQICRNQAVAKGYACLPNAKLRHGATTQTHEQA